MEANGAGMKIAVVIEHFDPARGGAETYTAGLVQWLAGKGHEVTVLAEDWSSEPANMTLVKVPVKGMTGARRYLSFSTEASGLVSSGGYDIIHSMARIVRLNVFQPHGGVTRASMERSLASSAGGVTRGLRRAARWLNTKSDILLELESIIFDEEPAPRFVAVSEMVADDMKRYHGVNASKIDVVPNGVDVRRFTPAKRGELRGPLREELGIGEDEVALLLVAQNWRLKGAEIFIKVVAELAERGHGEIRGIIVGSKGAGESVYPQLARKLGVGERVVFHESTSEIERFYAGADIYVHPTYYDPMSLVVLEAFASGMPAVTTRFNGCSEIMTEGVEGFTVEDPRDVERIVTDVEAMLERGRREEMGAAARALAEEYPLERNFEGIAGVYEKALAEGAAADVETKRGE